MREKPRDPQRLEHILDAIDKAQIIQTHFNSAEEAKDDVMGYYSLIKLVEIIGEASYMLTKEFKATHTEVPWRQIEGMRHILVHDYFTISPSDLWNVVCQDLPELRPRIEAYLREIS